MERIYDPLLYSFLIIGIDLYGKEKKCKFLRFIVSANFYVTSLIALIAGSFFLGFFLDGFKHDILPPFLLICSSNAQRFVLYGKSKNLRLLLKLLSKNRFKRRNDSALKNIRIIFSLICASVICIITSVFCILVTSSFAERFKSYLLQFPKWYLVLKNTHTSADEIFGIMFIYTLLFCCSLPICINIICYGLISWHLKTFFDCTMKGMLALPLSFKSNHLLYCQARNLITFTDDHFKYLTSLSILNMSITLYFVLFDKIQEHVPLVEYKVSKIIILLLIFISISIAVIEAGKIPVINQQILSAVNAIPLEEKLVGKRICLIHEVQQGLYLTIGGSTPITLSLLLVLTGTILSYSLLIKSFL